MKVYRLKDKNGNWVHSFNNHSMWQKLSWLKHEYVNSKYNDCIIVEFELVPTGHEQSVFSWKEGTSK